MRVQVKPNLLRWACRRARIDDFEAQARFSNWNEWLSGDKQPTLKQLEKFAKSTHTPIGFLFLNEPPREEVPIPDFRTKKSLAQQDPSPDLLDTVYACQQRQEWYREFAQWTGEPACPFVGTAAVTDNIVEIAERIRKEVGIDLEERRQFGTWADALRKMIERIDAAGILVMVSGVVGSDNHRKLDPEEFRGFALADARAPLIFVNGSDSKAAQMFTLAHELAHIYLGESALSDKDMRETTAHRIEKWCDNLAAEILVPLRAITNEFNKNADLEDELSRLARVYKVSTLVILRRLFDGKKITQKAYRAMYQEELHRLTLKKTGGGGNFYLTLGARASKRFAQAVVVSALEGRASFTEAFRLLGFRKMATFDELGRSLGVLP